MATLHLSVMGAFAEFDRTRTPALGANSSRRADSGDMSERTRTADDRMIVRKRVEG